MIPASRARMRRLAHVPALAGLVVVLATCEAAGPSSPENQLAVAFTFSRLGGGIVDVASVEIGATRIRDGATYSDTCEIRQDADADGRTVECELAVGIVSAVESFLLRMVLRDAEGGVVYEDRGDQTLEISRNSPQAVVVDVPLEYVGPGADAVELRILTTDPSVRPGQALSLTAVALDANGDVIPDVPIGWMALDPMTTVPNPREGVVVGGPIEGVGRVVAQLPTVSVSDNPPAGHADTIAVAVELPREVRFASANQTVAEGVGTATLTVELSGVSALPVTVPFTVDGTAALGTDYTITASPLTIPAGSLAGMVAVAVVDDAVSEGDETIAVTLGTPTNATLGTLTTHALTIGANDAPTVQFSVAGQTVSEGVGAATITIQVSNPSSQAVTVPFTVGGTATGGTDYTITASPLTIAAGSTTGTVTVTLVDDAVSEGDETVAVTLGTPTNATLGTPATHTLTVTDNEALPTVAVGVASQTVAEGAGTATIVVQLSNVSSQTVTVPFTVGGTATGGTDYTITASPLTIATGNTTGTVTVSVVNDAVAELDETIVVTLGAPTNGALGTPATHTITIAANDMPTVSLSAAGQTVAEGVGTATLTVQLSNVSSQVVTVPFTVGGTATGGTDYTITASPVTVPAGSTTATLTVAVVDDAVAEPNETVVVTLGSPTNATLGTPATHTVTIAANDTPTASFSAAGQAVAEGVGTATLTVQLSNASSQVVTVPYAVGGTATAGTDYTIPASPLTIAAGSTTGTVTVTVLDDAVGEPDETIVVTLGTPTGATLGTPAMHTLTIAGNDTPTVSFSAVSQAVAEGVGTATLTVQLSSVSTQVVTVPYTVSGTATGGTDYTIPASPVTIAAGSTTGTVTVTVVNDAVGEPDETIAVTLGTPTNATLGTPATHTITIAANDTPTVSFSATGQAVAEGVGTATITVQLSNASSMAVTVPYTVGGTATGGTDYTIPASPVTVAAGSSTGTLTVAVVDDAVAELNETVVVTLGTPTNATLGTPATHTLTIGANDTPTVQFSVTGQTVAEGGGTATITVQLSNPSSLVVTVPYTVGGTATAGTDYTIPASPVTIAAGSTTGTVTVTVVNDVVGEPNETVVVTLGTPTNATLGTPGTHTLTIGLNDTPTALFSATGQTVAENVGTATTTVQLSNPSSLVVTVPFTVGGTATGGADYAITISPVTIPAGSTAGTVTVTMVNDTIAEPSETVIVTLGTPTNATLGTPATHTVTVTDNEVALTVAVVGLGFVVSQGATPAVNCSYVNAPCTATYPLGTSVTLVASSLNPDFSWEYWTGTGSGFTCTTSSTCVVAMNQSRTVTARFSAPGMISLSPTTAAFTMQQGGAATPASQAITVSNVGDRPVYLSAIQISYSPNVTAWLSAQISSMVIDTLSPATLTLSVLSNSLAPGAYNATVYVGDFVVTVGQVNVTLTVTPPPTAPILSNVGYSLIQLNDDQRCTLSTPYGSSFQVVFNYTDPNGNGPTTISQAALYLAWTFVFGGPGSFSNYTWGSSVSGNGSSGTVTTTQCYRFGSNSYVDVTMTIQDLTGLRSSAIGLRIARPAGSN